MVSKRFSYIGFLALFQVLFGQQVDPSIRQGANPAIGTTHSTTWIKGDNKLNPNDTSCSVQNVDTSWAVENHPLEIEQHSLRMTEIGISEIDFYARNLESSPIEAVALVIEYTDEQGRVVERLAAAGTTKLVEDAFRPPFPFERVASYWNSPIAPGDSLRVQGVSNGLRAAYCPTHSTITFIMFQFVDGSIKKLSSAGWQIDPTPRMIPFVPQFSPDAVKLPISLVATIKIDTSGRVVDVTAQDASNGTDLLTTIRQQMIQSWRFNPGLRNGQPIGSELTALFRIHMQRTLDFPETKPLPSPVTLIDFFPDESNPGKLQIAYGRLFSGSTVQ